MHKPKIVFLYSEVAGYFLACAKELSLKSDVLVVRWKVNNEAPFDFNEDLNFKMIVQSDSEFDALNKIILEFNPDMIVCSGWMDKNYLKITKQFHKKIPTILTLDNHWTGGFKQRIASMLSPFYLKKIFSHAWVPGNKQKLFADKLGFKGKVKMGFYCADVNLFKGIYENQSQTFEKNFLYVGRYVEHKGIFEMWKAFIELQKENPNDWELICVGTGDQWNQKTEHPQIKHLGFKQPNELKEILNKKSIYILPSKFEPWGVSVQEFAVAGCPLILSERVGASETFLNSENGILLEEVQIENIKKAMKTMMAKTENELLEMSKNSHQIGIKHTPEKWTEILLSFLN